MSRKKLIDVFPDWLTTGGIFTSLTGMPWSTAVTGSILDIEYYGNISGDKAISPLVEKLLNTSGELPSTSIAKLVDIIKARYTTPWTKLYATLSIEYNPLHNFKVETTVTPDLEIKRTPNLTHTSTSSSSNTMTFNDTETVTDNTTETRTPNLTSEETSKEETIVSIQNSDESSQYGFNSSDAVPTDESEGSVTNTTTKDPTKNANTTTETGTETVANTGTTTTANTGSDTNAEQGLTTSTDTGTDTETHKGTETTETEGFRAIYGMQSQQVLLDEERKSWLWQFFDVVFRDVDSVLTIPIYIQEAT